MTDAEKPKPYGHELIMDLHGCDVSTFTRESLKTFFGYLCAAIKMKAEDLHFWDDEGVPPEERRTEPHAVGISAVQFIITSSIVIHALPLLEAVYVNVFSCKPFDERAAIRLIAAWFHSARSTYRMVQRI